MIYYNIEDINDLDGGCALTVGMFDGVHMGHRHLLELLQREAQSRNLRPLVVTFDRHPKVALGGEIELLMSRERRMQTLESLGFDVVVVAFTPDMAALSACDFARQILSHKLGVRLLVLGYDNRFGNRQHNDFDFLPEVAQEEHFEIIHDEAVSIEGVTVSSTKVRHALKDGNVELASKLLGQNHMIEGTIVDGRKVGRKLGFPTANVRVENLLLPQEGVYAVRVKVEGMEEMMKGMVNIGAQPTFGCTQKTVEVNIFGDCGDIYGRHIEMHFAAWLRSIAKFDNPDALIAQLEQDRRKSHEALQ